MTCSFLIQLLVTSGHQSVPPFLSGAPPPKKILDPPLYKHRKVYFKKNLVNIYKLTILPRCAVEDEVVIRF